MLSSVRKPTKTLRRELRPSKSAVERVPDEEACLVLLAVTFISKDHFFLAHQSHSLHLAILRSILLNLILESRLDIGRLRG